MDTARRTNFISVEFFSLSFVHLIAAVWCPIQDCDEVFNYWEPLHFLVHRSGMQTWEYAPQYALRSYLYLLLHAPPIILAKLAGLPKPMQFYALRCILALAAAACEATWLRAVSARLGPRLAAWALFFLLVSPGPFLASSALIPSSFAMLSLLLCQAAQLRGGRGAQAVLAGACGAVVGWPFCVVALAPVGVRLLLDFGLLRCVGWGLAALALTAGLTLAADTHFYLPEGAVAALPDLAYAALSKGPAAWFGSSLARDAGGVAGGPLGNARLVLSPLNLLLYNLFPRGTGSELYGVEPWHFYLRNLCLNFGPAALGCALASPVLLALLARRHHLRFAQTPCEASITRALKLGLRDSCLNTMGACAPFWLWLGFFTLLPHKEERFLFVVYPQLCLAAAATATALQTAALPTLKDMARPNSAVLIGEMEGGGSAGGGGDDLIIEAASPSFEHERKKLAQVGQAKAVEAEPQLADGGEKNRPAATDAKWEAKHHRGGAASQVDLAEKAVLPFGLTLSPLPLLGRAGVRALRALRRVLVLGVALSSLALGLGRSCAVVSHYGAPLRAYGWLSKHLRDEARGAAPPPPSAPAPAPARVCVGKEWHRFPSHFFLPDSAQLSFVESGFEGQLPRHFERNRGPWSGTRGPAPGASLALFNEVNAEQPDRYVDPSRDCDYLVDLGLAPAQAVTTGGREVPDLEPWRVAGDATCGADADGGSGGSSGGAGSCAASTAGPDWELVYSTPFLDSARTPLLARVLLLPQFEGLPKRATVPYEVFRRVPGSGKKKRP